MARLGSKLAALTLCGALGAFIAPACVINIGPGIGEDEEAPRAPEDEQTPPDPTEGAGGQMEAGGEAPGPEEQAALDALEAFRAADPETFAIRSAATAYVAVATANLVESQIGDPSTVDSAAVSQLFDQYAPIAAEQAALWMQSAEPSAFLDGVFAKYECIEEPHFCSSSEHCLTWEPPASCVVTQCGKGSCPWCPFWGNLMYDGWCGYACMQSGRWVGGAIKLRTHFFGKWDGPYCFRF
ncbi:hypothetical protein WME94_50290 [Sorangium sp. So ce429]